MGGKDLPFAGFCPSLEFISWDVSIPTWIVAPQRFQYSNFCPILKPWLYSGVRETAWDQHNLVLSAVPWEHPVATPSFLVAPPWRAPPFFVHGGPVPTLSPVVRSQGAFMLRAHQTLRQTSQMSSCHWRISSQRVRRHQTGYVATLYIVAKHAHDRVFYF